MQPGVLLPRGGLSGRGAALLRLNWVEQGFFDSYYMQNGFYAV